MNQLEIGRNIPLTIQLSHLEADARYYKYVLTDLCESGLPGLPLTNETVVLQLDPNVARRVNAVLLSARAARRRREAGSGETVLVPCAFLDAVHLVHGQWFITPNVSVADANYEGPYSPVRIRDADSGEAATNTARFI